MTIRTRFAPSPTGYLHIGGVRTALFNWLLARQKGGQFVLRIDDTDAQRNVAEALEPILDGFRWLGIDWDEGPEVDGPHGPYYQSQRSDSYKVAALKLLETGHAYPLSDATERDEAKKASDEAKKDNFVFRGKNRDNSPEENVKLYNEKGNALCLKIPEDTTITINDHIRGKVEWKTELIGDPVIVRANGSPLYNFATVVDEVNMKITHVIRAAEHLDNTRLQAPMYEALGYPVPEFAHVPVVNEPNSNKKLSKRRMSAFMTKPVLETLHKIGYTDEDIQNRDDLNPVTIAYYRELGYLPDAVINYLGRLGWSLDDETEIINRADMIAKFSLDRVNKSPASFDPEKMLWVAGEYMKELPLDEKVQGVLPYLTRIGLVSEPVDDSMMAKIRTVVEYSGERIKIFSDILNIAPLFLKPDPDYDEKAVEKKLKKEPVPELLTGFKDVLAKFQAFDLKPLEEALVSYCEAKGVKKNLLIHGLRVATTGNEKGIGVFEGLIVLGKDETLRRIDLALQLV
ncbi:MAG: glutamate--tRNA ligase [Gemmataceae bacterium]